MPLFQSLLPSNEGYLPYYSLILSGLEFIISTRVLLNLESLRSFYNLASGQQNKPDRKGASTHASNDQITPLVGRLFSHLTITLGSVRFYAAYHIHNGPVYDLALSTYVVGLAFMFIELYVFTSSLLNALA
ncbi:hypothetical protein XA68_15487 [Ophiocordyceps unilateralis]|uniref:Uncharacterized protein n=1 Tax=Ophiocordyceps unilateralis TaxID=268505 RepID=A0A2A9P8G3_OPHUN|nr:hypothetical protein XA68_15487 [Ophiocordyceps unilateralis]